MQKIKITRKLLRILKAYAKLFSRVEKRYYKERDRLEKIMENETGIKGIEFCDGEFSGIGTPNEPGKIKVIFRDRLEK